MAKILGKNVKVILNGAQIAVARSCTLDVDCEVIEVSDINSADYRKHIAGRKGWQVSSNGFVEVIKNGKNLVGQTVILSFQVDSSDYVTGSAICNHYHAEGTVGALAKSEFTFVGSGPLV